LKISKEIKTSLFVIAALLFFVWGYRFLEGRNLLGSTKVLYVEFDNVDGLGVSSPITINGLAIGKVNSVHPKNKFGHPIVVEMQIDNEEFFISKSSIAKLYAPSPIGGKQIQIVLNTDDTQEAISGDTLKGREIPGLLDDFSAKLQPLADRVGQMVVSADKLLTNLNSVLDDKTKANLRNSIANLDSTLAEFRGASVTLNKTLSDNKSKIDRTMTNLDKVSGNFAVVSDSLAKIEFGRTAKSLEQALVKVNTIMSGLEAGQGTAGKLLKDDALYKNLSKTSKELELLLQDLRLNPTRYINVSLFGKKNKPYKAPTANDTITVYPSKK
jgi:phospholipid/cholesterol/gamma-HCH transport system substrate-binding protein